MREEDFATDCNNLVVRLCHNEGCDRTGKAVSGCGHLRERETIQRGCCGYNKIVADSPDSDLAADALFELALINAHYDNPQRDYTRASRSFAEFLKRYPDNRRADEARTWISVLRTVQELKKQNEHLNENIEELKQLDIRHEERRK